MPREERGAASARTCCNFHAAGACGDNGCDAGTQRRTVSFCAATEINTLIACRIRRTLCKHLGFGSKRHRIMVMGLGREGCHSSPRDGCCVAFTLLLRLGIAAWMLHEPCWALELDRDADEKVSLPAAPMPEDETEVPHLLMDDNVVVKFLQLVEKYKSGGSNINCTAGTELNLGDGVVQQYGVLRFRLQAAEAVSRANLLTRLWMNAPAAPEPWFPMSTKGSSDADSFFFGQVVNMLESDRDIFAAGNCYDSLEFAGRYLFCPYAYRLPDGGILVKDLSVEYNYLGNESDWFYPARRKAEQLSLERELTISYERVTQNNMTVEHNRSVLLVTYEDGHWSRPYFDCGGGNIWMMTYIVPFFGYSNGTFRFKGTSGIDIDLQKVDINQCPLTAGKTEMNVFANSSRCLAETTECVPVSGLGFRRGSYKCICKPGYYFPLTDIDKDLRHYNGVIVENEYEKYAKGEKSEYATYQCLQCSNGCDTCEDNRPCILTLNWTLRMCLVVASGSIMVFVPALAIFVWKYREVKVVKASSPKLLYLILVGALFLYCPMLVSYFEASVYVCSIRLWLRAVGFLTSYGALMLKTWRISVVFRVRSARKIKISDTNLIQRLGIIVLVGVLYLTARMIWGRPEVITGAYINNQENLKAFQCSFNVWDYCQAGGEMLLLLWGVRLCIIVRKAPSEFNESRFISWAIYNETLLSLFLSLAMLFLQSPANPDLLYVVQFIHTNFTTTVTLIFLFGSKAYLVHRRKEKKSSKEDTLIKSKISNNSAMKYGKKLTNESSATTECYEAPSAILQKDIEDELMRVYTELELLKRAQMRHDNPHLQAKSGGHKDSNNISIHDSLKKNGSSGHGCAKHTAIGADQNNVMQSRGKLHTNNVATVSPVNDVSGRQPLLQQRSDTSKRSQSTSSAFRRFISDMDDSHKATPV